MLRSHWPVAALRGVCGCSGLISRMPTWKWLHCTFSFGFLVVICFSSMRSHSKHSNTLATAFKDSIYKLVTTQIYSSSWTWEQHCWILQNEWKFWARTVFLGFTLWLFSVILCNHRRSCGDQTSDWDHWNFLGIMTASFWSDVMSAAVGARIDSKNL